MTYVGNDCVFDMRVDGVADGYVKDYLG